MKILAVIGLLMVLIPASAQVKYHVNENNEVKYWANSFPEYFNPLLEVDKWNEVTSQKIYGASLTEYVPKGQTLNHWNELVTSRYYSYYRIGKRTASVNGIEPVVHVGENLCSFNNGKFEFTILSQTYNETVYRWTMKGCGKDNLADQTEYGRFKLGKYGYHHVTYAIKKPVITAGKETYALNVVKGAKLQVDDRCGDACLFPN